MNIFKPRKHLLLALVGLGLASVDAGALTLTVRMTVSPKPEANQALQDLSRRYRDALNYAIKAIIENKALSIGKAHELLYSVLKELFGLPSRIAVDCYREALAIARSWFNNPGRGGIPRVKSLRIWLTPGKSYRVRDGCVELPGGLKLDIIGWDRRYDGYPSGEARLVLRDNKTYLMVTKRVPKPAKYEPRGVIAVDVNENHIVVGNKDFEVRFETPVRRALHRRILAENLQKKYSSPKYNAWKRRSGILERIKAHHAKVKNIVLDWARKTSHRIVEIAKQKQHAIAREDLTGLIESLRKLPKSHKVKLLILSYRKLTKWIDWQSEKQGAPEIIVEPKGTSTECPKCHSRMRENGYRRLKCPDCGFEADRDTVGVMNIEGRALEQMGGSLTTPTAPQRTDVNPNRWGEPPRPKRGGPSPLPGRGGGQYSKCSRGTQN